MTTLLNKGMKIAKSLIEGTIRTLDPGNVDSRLQRGDMQEPNSEPAVGDARGLIDLGEARFEESRVGRYRQNARIFSGIAMYQGRQHDYWDEDQACMLPLPGASGGRNPDFDERMMRSTWNIIRVFAERTVARVMAAAPDAWAAPQTDSPEDKQAAQILRAINAHCDKNVGRRELLEESLLAAYISTTCFIEVGWDAMAWADVAIPQPDGTIRYKRAQIGDVSNHLMLCIDAYPDPNAALNGGNIHNGAYFIKRCTRTLGYIADKWGAIVEATGPSSTYGFLERRLEWISDDNSRYQAQVKDCTDVTEVWEKPSERFEDGRYWAYTTDGTLLYAGKWPYEKKDKYPFVPVKYQKAQGSVWGLNGVDDLKPIQIDLNDLATYLRTRLQWDRPVLMDPDNSEIAPESLLSPALGKVIPYDANKGPQGIPTYMSPPAPPQWLFLYWDKLMAQAEYIAGVRDFNSDAAQKISSGFQFELMVEQEKSRLGPVIRHMENAAVELMEWDGAFYRQFGTQLPRLLGVDDKANPNSSDMPQAAAMDLRALKNGNTRVVLQPGSGQSKSPAAQEARLDEIVKNLANPNMNPALAKMYLSLCQAIRSDKQVDDFNMEFGAYYAAQAQQAQQVQAMKGDQAQQASIQKSKDAEMMAAIEQHTAESESAIKVHAAITTEAARAQADQNVEQHRAQAAAELETLKFNHAMALLQAGHAAPPKFSVSMPFKPGPTTIRSAEEAMGLEPDSAAESKLANAPPKPAGPPKKKGQS